MNRCLVIILLGLPLLACASYTDETREIRNLYKRESYRDALAKLEKSSIKEASKNRLLYRMEKAMILDRLGQRTKSRRLLQEADKIADDLYTVSVSKTATSFIVNDAATDYEGEDFEVVAIHTVMALSFLADGEYSSATVEARKINNKLNEINGRYEAKGNKYGEDAFARYLAGVIHESRGNWDSAIVDYAKALALYNGSYGKFVWGGTPDHLVRALYRLYKRRGRTQKAGHLKEKYGKLAGQVESELRAGAFGELVVIHELGHIATKSTGEFFLGVGKQLVRFSFPVYKKRHHGAWGQTGVEVVGKKYYSGENVQDMDAIARQTLEDRRLRIMAKQTARLLAKGQLTEQAYKNFGVLGGLAANVYSVVSETADTRSWTLLPEAYFMTRVRLKPGEYKIKVKTAGRLSQIQNLRISDDKVVIWRDFG